MRKFNESSLFLSHTSISWCVWPFNFKASGVHRGEKDLNLWVSTMDYKSDIEKFFWRQWFQFVNSKYASNLNKKNCVNASKSIALLSLSLTRVKKTEMMDKSRSTTILCHRGRSYRNSKGRPLQTCELILNHFIWPSFFLVGCVSNNNYTHFIWWRTNLLWRNW